MRAAKCGRARARRVMLVLFIGFDWRCFWGASSTFLTSTAAAAPAATATAATAPATVGGGRGQRQFVDCTVCGESVGFSQ